MITAAAAFSKTKEAREKRSDNNYVMFMLEEIEKDVLKAAEDGQVSIVKEIRWTTATKQLNTMLRSYGYVVEIHRINHRLYNGDFVTLKLFWDIK
jgi:hypothetical protein